MIPNLTSRLAANASSRSKIGAAELVKSFESNGERNECRDGLSI